MANLILVGAGQIGTRHLQAAARCDAVSGIRIVERSEVGRRLAVARWAETRDKRPVPECRESLDDMPQGWADIAIVATSAIGRRSIVEDLLRLGVRRILIEKLAFQHPHDYDHVLRQSGDASIHVNCIYRYAPILQHVRKRLAKSGSIEMKIDAGDIGMATNLPHWMDMLSYLTETSVEEIQISIDGTARESKRGGGLREFSGEAVAVAGGGVLRISCRGRVRAPKFRIESDGFWVEIDESSGAVHSDILDLRAMGFSAPMVSQTSTIAIREMIAGNCALPTLYEVATTDRTMLRAVAKALGLDESANVPIT